MATNDSYTSACFIVANTGACFYRGCTLAHIQSLPAPLICPRSVPLNPRGKDIMQNVTHMHIISVKFLYTLAVLCSGYLMHRGFVHVLQ